MLTLLKPSPLHRFGSAFQSPWRIHPEETHSSAADSAQSDNPASNNNEMLRPLVATGMEQGDDGFGFSVYSGKVRTLVIIAAVAGPSEVVMFGGTSVLESRDVLEVKRLQRR